MIGVYDEPFPYPQLAIKLRLAERRRGRECSMVRGLVPMVTLSWPRSNAPD